MYLPFLSCECDFNSNLFLLECEKVLSSHHVVYIGFDWWVRVVFALPGYPWGGFFSTSELETVGQPWRWNYTILLYQESLFQSWKLGELWRWIYTILLYPESSFKEGNCRRARRWNYTILLYRESLFQSWKLWESPEDETIQHFLIGSPANFGEDEGGDTIVQ